MFFTAPRWVGPPCYGPSAADQVIAEAIRAQEEALRQEPVNENRIPDEKDS